MKINFKLRFKNKTTLLSLIACIVAFIYQMLGFFEVVSPISEDMVMQFISTLLTILVSVGVLVDPTTKGISDSNNAMSYEEPRKDV